MGEANTGKKVFTNDLYSQKIIMVSQSAEVKLPKWCGIVNWQRLLLTALYSIDWSVDIFPMQQTKRDQHMPNTWRGESGMSEELYNW